MVTKYVPPCCRAGYVCDVKKIDVPMYSSEQAWSQISTVRSSTQATKYFKTTNYANVAYDFLFSSCPTAWRRQH